MSYENNKQLVLEILYSMNTKINLRNNEFQQYFNTMYDGFYNNKNQFDNITEMNKSIINNCYQKINQISNVNTSYQQETSIQNQNRSINPYSNQSNTIETIDINEIRHKKDDKFTFKLKNKQEEFDNFMKKPDPKSIDFSLKYDEPEQNLDNLMNQSLADREKELQAITNKYNSKTNNDFLKPQDTRSDKKKIVSQQIENNKKEKHVTFATNNNNIINNVNSKINSNKDFTNFLSKLKKKPQINNNSNSNSNVNNNVNSNNNINSNNILTLLNKIVNNQEIIINNQNIILKNTNVEKVEGENLTKKEE
tara:strand:- start:1073 stop:1996 length:924 start_codon:yes stop_codon:yes gene_type:complete